MTDPTRTAPDGTTDISGADLMDKYKAEIEAASRGTIFALTNVSGVNSITADAVIPIPDYYDGMTFWLDPPANNTSGVTVNIDSKGAKSLRDPDGNVLGANSLVDSRRVPVTYVAASDYFKMLAGSLGGASQDSEVFIAALRQSNNTDGGTATAGSYQTYPLNTEVQNDLSGEGAALSSNEITLPAGTYDFYAQVSFYQTGKSRIRLYNQSDGAAVTGQGKTTINATTVVADISEASCFGRFTIATTKTFRLQYRVATTSNSDGLGDSANFSENEDYGFIFITRPAAGGQDGADGADGASGIQQIFDNATADADPGNGEFRFNNSDPASATVIFVDDLENAGGSDVSSRFSSWESISDSTVKGVISIQGIDDPGDWADFELDSITDATGYTKLNVTPLGASGAFGNSERYGIQFAPSGDTGSQGSTGATGPNLGLDMQWNTATSGDPGSGKLRGDNATPASITSIAFSDLERNGNNIEAIIQAADNSDSTVKATIRVVQVNDTSKWYEFQLDSLFADQTGYWTATVTYVAGGTAIDNDAIVGVLFSRTGDSGGLQAANDLSDVNDADTAAQNIGALRSNQNLSDVDDVDTARNNILAEPQAVRLGSSTKTSSYTLALADAGTDVRMNVASANNMTIPPNSSVAFLLDTVITGGQYGAGITTIVPGSGVTIRSRDGNLVSAGQYARWEMMKIGTNEWWVAGDLVG